MKFTHLHVHSHYSLLDGLTKIDDLLDYVKKLGMDSVALTDHGVLYGAVEFYKKAKKAGIKPIIGCEVYMAYEKMSQKRPNIDDKRYHLVLLVKNEQGYKNLVKLVTDAHLKGFYYKPRIDDELLAKHSSGLIALTACIQGKIPQLILANKIKQAEDYILKYKKIFGKGNFYLEIQDHPNSKKQKKVNETLIKLSKELDVPLVATNDSHYLEPEDAKAQDILMLINTGAKADDPARLTMESDDFSLRTPKQMAESFKHVPEALKNTQKIKDLCNFDFKLGKTKLPYFETPSKETPDIYLEKLCKEKITDKYPLLSKKDALKRLEYELSVIKEMGFASYFLIVQDFVRWAKENRIVVGPGRGSAGGSIVAYLLNITTIDPLKHDLLFERFLNPARISMPDIDLDFADRRRDEVIDYVAEKYGRNKVAQIITFGTMAARAVIRDVGRATGVEYNYCDKLAKMIPFGSNLKECLQKVAEFRQLYKTDQTATKLIDFALKLEGCARHASTHACGVVISESPLDEIVPLQHPTQNDHRIVTQYEMHSIEDLGLLKMDFLGLKNLTIIEDTLSRIYMVQNKKIDIEQLPLDDKKTYKIFRNSETTGVFQLESDGMKRYLKELKPSIFEDIVAMVALYRPGPMQFIPEYIERKNKRRKTEYLHPKLKPILQNTYGICIFQEQLMQIARVIAGFSLSEADILRKAIGKKIEKLLFDQKDKFIKGTVKNKIKKEIGEKIWDWILPFARYGFNRAHATAYAKIAYQTAYLKAHFPVEFMSALLTSEKTDLERISYLIEECKNMEIDVLPPDINESFRNFSVVPNEQKIRFGLLAIKNVGSNIVEVIIKERKNAGKFKSITDFISRIDSKDLNKRSLESLIKTGAFDNFEERNKLLSNMEEILNFNREIRKAKTNGQKSLFHHGTNNPAPSFKLKDEKPLATSQKLLWEKELLGLYISSHPLESFKNILNRKTISIKDLKNGSFPYTIRAGGIILSVKKILTKKGKPMLFIKLEDLTDKIEVIVFSSSIEKNPTAFQENKIVFITGRLDTWNNTKKIICENIEEIIEK